MEKRELNLEELEKVNGAGAKEFFEKFIEICFGGMIEETKNDVPHK